MKLGEFLDEVRRIFFAKLEEKTGWGKEQIKNAYLASVAEAALNFADKDL